MLIIKRESGQSFLIGDATVTLHSKKGHIKVLIDAPKHIPVWRSEIAPPKNKHNYLSVVKRIFLG